MCGDSRGHDTCDAGTATGWEVQVGVHGHEPAILTSSRVTVLCSWMCKGIINPWSWLDAGALENASDDVVRP